MIARTDISLPGNTDLDRPELCGAMTGEERRQCVRDTLRALSRREGELRAQLAELLAEVHDRRYWKSWGHKSFRAYVGTECDLAYRSAQVLVKVVHRFRELGVPDERLQRLEWSKAELVARVVDRGNLAELMRAMEQLPYAKLRAKVRDIQTGRDRGQVGNERNRAAAALTSGNLADLPVKCGEWRLPKPPASQFYVVHKVWEQISHVIGTGGNALLIGPSGVGKTELCNRAAAAAGRTIQVFHCGAMSEARSALIGNTHFDKARGTWFAESPFVRAVTRPDTVIVLDEISRAVREAFNIFLSLLAGDRSLHLDESEDAPVIHRAPGVSFLATANVGIEYTGADQIDWALQSRFSSIIRLAYPPNSAELLLLTERYPGLDHKSAKWLIGLATRQRELAGDGEFVSTISTRDLLGAGEQIRDGISFENAVEHCIVNRFSAEGGEASEQAKLLQIVQKIRA
jgi:hypothetical protein